MKYSPYTSNYIELREKRDQLRGLKRKLRPTNYHWNICTGSRVKHQNAAKPQHKVCNRCGLEKPYAVFYKDKSIKDGYLGHCKQCHNLHASK